MLEILIATCDIDHCEIEGRKPILRTHYLYEIHTKDDKRSKRHGFTVIKRSWYITIDGSSKTHINEDKARAFILNKNTVRIDKRQTDILTTITY